MKTGKVYLVTNQINGKRYVGFTIRTAEYRFNCHIKGVDASKLLHEAIKTFGKENFIVETIFEGTYKQALNKEKYFIQKYKTRVPNGYNQTNGGEAYMLGKIASEATLEKMSLAQKGKKHSEATLEKMRSRRPSETTLAKMRGRKLTEATRAKMSLAKKGHVVSKETRVKISAAGKGRVVSEITREKLSVANIGKTHSEATRIKLRGYKYWLGRKHSEETKAKISAAKIGKIASNETRAKMSIVHKGNKYASKKNSLPS